MYGGVADAFATIYAREGGPAAFFAGLGADLAKSAADSFLFFLFYTVSGGLVVRCTRAMPCHVTYGQTSYFCKKKKKGIC